MASNKKIRVKHHGDHKVPLWVTLLIVLILTYGGALLYLNQLTASSKAAGGCNNPHWILTKVEKFSSENDVSSEPDNRTGSACTPAMCGQIDTYVSCSKMKVPPADSLDRYSCRTFTQKCTGFVVGGVGFGGAGLSGGDRGTGAQVCTQAGVMPTICVTPRP